MTRSWRWAWWALLLVIAGWWVGQLGRTGAELLATPWRLDPPFVAVAFLGWLTYTALGALGWWLTLTRVGGALGPLRGGAIWARSMLARYVPGNVWHVLVRVQLARAAGTPAEATVLATAAEQVLLVAASGALALALVSGRFAELDPRLVWLPALLPLLLAGLHPRLLVLGARALARLTGRPSVEVRLTVPALLLLLGWYAATFLVGGLAFAALAAAAGLTLPPALLVGYFNLAYVVGYLSFVTPSGIGVREAALVLLLERDAPAALAVVLALAARLLLMLAEGAAAGLTAGLAHLGASPGRAEPAGD